MKRFIMTVIIASFYTTAFATDLSQYQSSRPTMLTTQSTDTSITPPDDSDLSSTFSNQQRLEKLRDQWHAEKRRNQKARHDLFNAEITISDQSGIWRTPDCEFSKANVKEVQRRLTSNSEDIAFIKQRCTKPATKEGRATCEAILNRQNDKRQRLETAMANFRNDVNAHCPKVSFQSKIKSKGE
jgi:hypothetical protein